MVRTPIVAATLAAALVACGGDVIEPIAGRVDVHAADGILTLRNATSEPVFFFAVNARLVPLINWAPCVDASRCPHVQPGETATGPYDELITLYDPADDTAIVYWWHAVRGEDGVPGPDSIRAVGVQL